MARPFGFLRPQAGAAAAVSAHDAPSATGPVSSAQGDDVEIKADDNDDKPKPEQWSSIWINNFVTSLCLF